MNQSFGRGALISKMLALGTPSTDGISNKTSKDCGLITPDQFLNAEIEKTDVKEAKYERIPETESPAHQQHLAASTDRQIPSSHMEVQEDQAEKEWKIYQFQRKIKKIVKDVDDTNLDQVMNELQNLLEECPLSSRFTNCSEVKEFLEVIMVKAIKDNDFLIYAPCLIKMAAEQQAIDFKKYFPEITDQIQKDNITLCASDDLLSTSGKNFCQLIGHILSMPRQLGTDVYDVVLPVAEEFMETWSYPYEEDFCFDGFKEEISMIHADAAKHFLLALTSRLLPCDNMLMERMERFMWQIRESVLNIKLPRTVRSSYLNVFTDVQMAHAAHGCTTSGNISLDNTVSDKEEFPDGEMVIETETKSDFEGKVDEYMAVKGLLTDLDMDDLISIFIANEINDDKIFTTTFEKDLESAGVKKFQRFSIMLKVGNTDISELRKLANGEREFRKPNETESLKADEKLGIAEEETGDKNIKQEKRKSTSNRMAINFTKKESSFLRPVDDLQKTKEKLEGSSSIHTNEHVNPSPAVNHWHFSSPNQSDDNHEFPANQFDYSRAHDPLVKQSDDNHVSVSNPSDDSGSIPSSFNQSDDSEPDVVLESEEYEQITTEETPAVKPQTITSVTESPSIAPAPVTGRGRGMVSLKVHSTHSPGSDKFNRKPPFKNRQDDKINHFDNTSHNFRRQSPGGTRWSEHPRQHFQNERKKPDERNFNRNHNRYNNDRKFNPKGKFQARYHKKEISKPEDDVSKSDSVSTEVFGLRKPRGCLRCGSLDHITDDCPVINPFF